MGEGVEHKGHGKNRREITECGSANVKVSVFHSSWNTKNEFYCL